MKKLVFLLIIFGVNFCFLSFNGFSSPSLKKKLTQGGMFIYICPSLKEICFKDIHSSYKEIFTLFNSDRSFYSPKIEDIFLSPDRKFLLIDKTTENYPNEDIKHYEILFLNNLKTKNLNLNKKNTEYIVKNFLSSKVLLLYKTKEPQGIFTYNILSKKLHPLIRFYIGGLILSPDKNKLLLFGTMDKNKKWEYYIYNVKNKKSKKLNYLSEKDDIDTAFLSFVWSSDSDKLAFFEKHYEKQEIASNTCSLKIYYPEIDSIKKEYYMENNLCSQIGDLEWNPDGNKFLFSSPAWDINDSSSSNEYEDLYLYLFYTAPEFKYQIPKYRIPEADKIKFFKWLNKNEFQFITQEYISYEKQPNPLKIYNVETGSDRIIEADVSYTKKTLFIPLRKLKN